MANKFDLIFFRYHPNRYTFGGVIAERVKTVDGVQYVVSRTLFVYAVCIKPSLYFS